jgi:hypothetical protein
VETAAKFALGGSVSAGHSRRMQLPHPLQNVWSHEKRTTSRALADTWNFIRTKIGSASVAVLSLAVGSVVYYHWYGKDAMWSHIHFWIAYVLIGSAVSVLLVIVAQLIAAPARLLFEAEHERDALRQTIRALEERLKPQLEFTWQESDNKYLKVSCALQLAETPPCA